MVVTYHNMKCITLLMLLDQELWRSLHGIHINEWFTTCTDHTQCILYQLKYQSHNYEQSLDKLLTLTKTSWKQTQKFTIPEHLHDMLQELPESQGGNRKEIKRGQREGWMRGGSRGRKWKVRSEREGGSGGKGGRRRERRGKESRKGR